MKRFAWIISFLVAPAIAGVTPDDFDVRLPIEAPSQASLLRIKLPEDIYQATRGSDLADLRIFNAAGEAVPMARMPHAAKRHEQRIDLPLQPLPEDDVVDAGKLILSQDYSGANVRVEINGRQRKPADKFAPGYLLEVKGFDLPVDELIMRWPGALAFEAAVQIRVSDDLINWRTLVNRIPVLTVGVGEARIRQDRVRLPAVKTCYMRIDWVGTVPDVTLDRVTLIHHARSQALEHRWLTLEGKVKGDSIIYAAPGLFPVERVRLAPVGDADVLPATLYSRRTVSARWRRSVRTLGYRLRQDGGFADGRPDVVARTRDPLWRVDLDKGARSSSAPRLQLGWMPEEVVFVARGAGPFTLAVGNPSATPVWLAPDQVVPGFETDKAATVIPAQVLSGGAPVNPVVRNSAPWQNGANWLLWGVLVFGVVVLGVMARGLWRDLRINAAGGSDSNK